MCVCVLDSLQPACELRIYSRFSCLVVIFFSVIVLKDVNLGSRVRFFSRVLRRVFENTRDILRTRRSYILLFEYYF